VTEQEYFVALAKNLYLAHKKLTTGETGQWSKLEREEQQMWSRLVRRNLKKIAELGALDADEAI